MSYAIGCRIRELRAEKKVSQEQLAEVLDTTRQRYSRIESGQVDISFVMIKKIADFLGVPTYEITNVENENKELVTFFREKDTSEDIVKSISKIEEILRIFHAHEKLYYQMKEQNEYED